MNYQPFAQLEIGALFRDMDHQHLLMMKTAEADKAVVIEGGWVGPRLYRRGATVPMTHNECVILLDGPDKRELPLTAPTPIDPRRTFWKEGQTRAVGREIKQHINVFAGLFVYAGFGMGTYYDATGQEEHWLDVNSAARLADFEKVPFVNYDSAQWTSDPTLARERAAAQALFAASTEPTDTTAPTA